MWRWLILWLSFRSSRSVSGKNFANFEMLDAKTASEKDHPEFPIQEEGQSGGTESPERRPVSTTFMIYD